MEFFFVFGCEKTNKLDLNFDKINLRDEGINCLFSDFGETEYSYCFWMRKSDLAVWFLC